MRRPGGNNAFLVSAVGRRCTTAGGHMRPVRGTLPSDRRKSCWLQQGLSSHWGAGGLGLSGSQSRCCQGSRLHVPPRLPEQGPPSPATGPYGPFPSQKVSDPVILSTESPGKPGVYFVSTSKRLRIPPPPLAVPRWTTLAHSAAWNPAPQAA